MARPFDAAAELDWSHPVTSRRLLAEHLDQSHDGASRRLRLVERQVRRLARLLPPPPAAVLDAGCGPGLYSVRLAHLGYRVTGVDVGPAVLHHARATARAEGVAARFVRCDLRRLPWQERFDAAICIYYVLESFPRTEQVGVLRRLAAALRPGGTLVAEVRTCPDQPPGRLASWEVVPRSLLDDRPHLLLADSTWEERRRLFVLREVAVHDDGRVSVQQTTGALLPPGAVGSLFARGGFAVRATYDGWSRRPATPLSQSLLVVAESRPGARRR